MDNFITFNDIENNIDNGDYSNPFSFPKLPLAPRTLGKTASQMTNDEIRNLNQIQAKYEENKKIYDSGLVEWKKGEEDRIRKFQADLQKAANFTGSKEVIELKHLAVWKKAWDHGIGNGLSNVLYWYKEFSEIANLQG